MGSIFSKPKAPVIPPPAPMPVPVEAGDAEQKRQRQAAAAKAASGRASTFLSQGSDKLGV